MKLLLQRKDCRWLSATNADNIYGSEVVERVRNVVKNPEIYKTKHKFYRTIPDLVIAPLDSRNLAEIGELANLFDDIHS